MRAASLFLLLLLLVACSSVPTAPSPTPAALALRGYDGSTEGFAISYPDGWSLRRGSAESGVLFVATDPRTPGASLSLVREALPEGDGVQGYIQQSLRELRESGRLGREANIRALRLPAGEASEVQYEVVGVSGRLTLYQYVLRAPDRLYVLTLAAPSERAAWLPALAARVAASLRLS